MRFQPFALAATLVVTPFFITPVFAQAAQEDRDVGFIQGLIEDNLSNEGTTVRIEGFDGALSSRAVVGELTIADTDGVWLRATDLALDWNRSALLRGRVEVQEMSAGTIEIIRAPLGAETTELPDAQAKPFSFALPDLPVGIDIEQIRADRIVLGAALLGTQYDFSLDGQVALSGGEGTANIVAERLDATVGSFEIAGAYSNDTRILALTLDLTEAADGLVAKALDIPGRPSVRLLLNGEAPIDDYAATLSIATDGTERIAGEFGLVTVASEGDGPAVQDVRLDITGDVTALIDTGYADFFGTDARLALQGGRDAAGAITLRALEVEAQAVQLTGSAAFAPDGWPLTLDLEGRVAGPDGAPVLLPGAGSATYVDEVLLDVAFDAAAGDEWQGVFTLMGLDHPAVTIPVLTLDGSGVIVPARADTPGRFTADVAYSADALTLADAGLAEALGAQIAGRLAVARVSDGPFEISALTLTGPGVELSSNGTVQGPADGFATDVAATLTAADLGRFGAVTGLDLAGQADVGITASLRPLDGIFDLSIDGTTADLALGIAELDPLLAGDGTVDLVAARDTDGTRLETLRVVTDETTVTATADITNTGLSADFALDIRDLGIALDGLDGPATITGTATTGAGGFTAIDARAALRGTTADIAATLPPAQSTTPADISISADIADLAPFSPLAGRDLGGAIALMLTGTAAMDATTFDLAITGDSTDLAVGIDQLDPFLAGAASLQGRAVRSSPLSLNIEDFSLTSPTVSLTADARIVDGVGDAEFDLALADVAPALPDLSGALSLGGTVSRDAAGAVTADVAGDGPGDAAIDIAATLTAAFALQAEAEIAVGDLRPYSALAGQQLAGSLTLTAAGSATDATDTATTPFDVVFRTSLRDLAAGERRLTGTFGANGIAGRSDTGALTVLAEASGPGGLALDAQGSMAAPADGGALAGQISLSAQELGVYSAILGEDLAGSVDLAASGTAMPDGSTFDVTFDLSGADLSGYGYGLPGAITASGTAGRAEDGSQTADIDATGPGDLVAAVDATMGPAADGGRISGSVSARARDLSVYSGLAQSPLSGAVELSATGSALPDASAFDVTFDLSGRDLSGLGQSLPGALAANGTAARDAGGVTSVDVAATGPGNAVIDVDGTLASAADGGQINGLLTAQIASLAPYSGLAGRGLAGSVDLDLSGMVWPDLSGFDLDFDLSGSDLSAGGVGLPGGLAARGTALRETGGETSIDLDATGPGGLDVTLTANGTDTVRVDLNAGIDSLSTYAGLIGRPVAGGLTADLRGTTALDFSTFDLALDATTRSIDPGIPALRPLLAGTGRIDGQVSRGPGGTLRATGLDVAFAAFSVSGDFDSAGGSGGGTFEARLADVGQFVDGLAGPATAGGSARLQPGGGVSLNIEATGPGGTRATVLGSVLGNGNLALNINGAAPLALANPFIAPRTLEGQSTFALSVNGPPAITSLGGTVTLAEGRLFAPTLGQTVTGLGGTVQFRGGQAVLDLGAGLDAGGRLSVAGPIGLSAPNTADLSIAAENLILRDPTLFETTANGRITVTGPLAGGARIAGTVDIGETEIRVPSSGISVLGDLPVVTHVEAPADVRQTLNRAGLTIAGVEAGTGGGGGGGGTAYPVDLLIRAPARIFIRGRGVDAELGGELRITGTTAQLIPIGQFELVRGRIDILQQRFELDEGGAFLQGDFVPFIRLVATTETGDGTTVSVIVEGPADDPEVRFESQPDLPQDEVLARLIFGRDLSSISPLQAVQLAAAVSTLAGRGGGGLIDDFRQGIGLDDLDIVTDDEGGVGVRAGAYLTENVYTDVVIGTDNTEITLNLDVTDDITVTGTAGSDGDTAIGIFFERDY